MKPKFSTLIVLTLVMAAILLPFALSGMYIPWMRDGLGPAFGHRNFSILAVLQTDLYKLSTGFLVLALVVFELVLALRKRGRRWKIAVPGSILFWRSLHIFVGVGLVATVMLHTGGATGDNFNAIFLWVFFGVALSALTGVVAETGILESSQKYFGLVPEGWHLIAKRFPPVSKGPLIRKLRAIWLSTHIILVSMFCVMLGFHIFLAFYFQ